MDVISMDYNRRMQIFQSTGRRGGGGWGGWVGGLDYLHEDGVYFSQRGSWGLPNALMTVEESEVN